MWIKCGSSGYHRTCQRTLAISKEQKSICERVIDRHSAGPKKPLPHREELRILIQILRKRQEEVSYHLRPEIETLIGEVQRVLDKKEVAARIKAERQKDGILSASPGNKNLSNSANSNQNTPSSGYQPTIAPMVPAFERQPVKTVASLVPVDAKTDLSSSVLFLRPCFFSINSANGQAGGKEIFDSSHGNARRIDVQSYPPHPDTKTNSLKSESWGESLRSHLTAKQPTINALPAPQPVMYNVARIGFDIVDDTRNLFITQEQEDTYHRKHNTNHSLVRSIYRFLGIN
jgi:hypothetical protein